MLETFGRQRAAPGLLGGLGDLSDCPILTVVGDFFCNFAKTEGQKLHASFFATGTKITPQVENGKQPPKAEIVRAQVTDCA